KYGEKICSGYERLWRSIAVIEVPEKAFASNGIRLYWKKGLQIDLKWINQSIKNRERKTGIILRKNILYLKKAKIKSGLIQNENIKRLGIYFFYDEQGVVDDYVEYYLEAFRSMCSETCVVVNGKLGDVGKKTLENVCDKLIIRENIGFDSCAYKDAIISYGYFEIGQQYDELVLHNFTNFGPIFPFEKMMNEMTSRECDFWGHCRYIAQGNEEMGGQPVIDHLMSYFLTFKRNILQSEAFRRYWETLRIPQNYAEAVVFHEMRCTEYFEKLGFISDAYMSSDKYRYMGNAPVFCPYKQLLEDHSPLLKRKVFFVKEGYFAFQMHSNEPSVYELIEYIRDNTNYDTMMIFKNIERTQDLIIKPEATAKMENRIPFSHLKFLNSCKKLNS
ncbi:MAG: rhamnan synthesis F family protein, partial [Clostridia bacterium]|nr:rhamnan synthesis F family protein [Clostridia bacterium]